jgi:hypothetical protein
MGPEGGVYPMVVTETVFCRWADVDFSGFYLLGTIEAIEDDGTAADVAWRIAPRDCLSAS